MVERLEEGRRRPGQSSDERERTASVQLQGLALHHKCLPSGVARTAWKAHGATRSQKCAGTIVDAGNKTAYDYLCLM
jgi:hypothetical protein